MPHALSSTVDTAAEFDVHPETLRRLRRSGRIRGYMVGRVLRFDIDEVRDALRTPTGTPSRPHAEPNFDALDERKS
jgi:excisionase family DNA binding protein